MFLHELAEYAKTIAHQLPPPMYQPTSIRYVCILSKNGTLRSILDLQDETNKRGQSFAAPYCKRAGKKITAKILVDTGEYTFGLLRDPGRRQEAAIKRQAYRDVLEQCINETGSEDLKVVARFLDTMNSSSVSELDPAENVTFRLDGGDYLFQQPEVQAFWAKKAAAADEESVIMQCLVCGELKPAVERLPIVIKGIPEGQATGMTLISANEAAYESYGLTASYIAPTCESCGELFGNALNELLRNELTHLVISPLVYIFWTKRKTLPIEPVILFQNAPPDQVKALLEAPVKADTYTTAVDADEFYAATLSASGARVVVRDWIETATGDFVGNMQRYFWLQGIQGLNGTLEYFPMWKLIRATINPDTKEKPLARVGQALMHFALHGGALPLFLLHAVLGRIRAKQKIQIEQAALIKMILLSQTNHAGFTVKNKGEIGMVLTTTDHHFENNAYVCGRLLGLLEHIQYRALGSVNATNVDRFYGTASSAPAVVFPRLLRNSIAHLAAIRKDRYFYLGALETDLALLTQKISAFPKHLTLVDQGWFALGFHHQRAEYIKPAKTNDTTQNAGGEEIALAEESVPVQEGIEQF